MFIKSGVYEVMKGIIRAVITLCIAGQLASCTGGLGSCPPSDEVAVVGLGSAVNIVNVETGNAFNQVEYVTTESSLPSNRYVISVATQITPAEIPRLQSKYFFEYFIKTAIATCNDGSITTDQLIRDINIVSDQTVSEDLAAGQPLRDVFRIQASNEGTADNNNIVRHVLFLQAREDIPLISEYLRSSPKAPLRFLLIMEASIPVEALHTFSVTYQLVNGEVFTITTDPIELTPAT